MEKPRSLGQLRYAHGVVLKALMQHAEEQGQPIPKDEAKRLAYIAVGHWEYKTLFGRAEIVRKPTPKDVGELEELLESIRAWAAGFGLTILLPNEGVTYPAWVEDTQHKEEDKACEIV